MSAREIVSENIPHWLAYVARQRAAAGDWGISLCERGHDDCSPVWNGTCSQEVFDMLKVSSVCEATPTTATPEHILDELRTARALRDKLAKSVTAEIMEKSTPERVYSQGACRDWNALVDANEQLMIVRARHNV